MKQKVLLVGDYLSGTGFHRVVAHIKNAIKDDFEIHHIGIAYHGEVHTTEDGVTVYPETDANGGQYGHKYIARLIDQIQPDIFFIVYDIIFIRYLLESLRHKSKHMIRGAYLALDGDIVQKRRKMISPLKELDFCIWYTDFAQDHIDGILKEQPSLLSKPIDFRVIPHGVDSSTFYPIAEDQSEKRRLARKEIFPQLENPEDTFIVLNANTSSPRKRTDLTLRAFAKFAEGKSSDQVKLCLHQTFSKGKLDKYDAQIVAELGLEDYLIKSPLSEETSILTNAQLNLLYNACDVGMNTCMGEGWGLVNFEHAATRVPQILPAHSCFPSIWKDSVLWVTEMQHQPVNFTSHDMYAVDVDSFAHQLEEVYENPQKKEHYAHLGYENVTQEAYRWDTIESQWNALIHEYANSWKLKALHEMV